MNWEERVGRKGGGGREEEKEEIVTKILSIVPAVLVLLYSFGVYSTRTI